METLKKCQCGCGTELPKRINYTLGSEICFVHGHNNKGKHLSTEWANNIGKKAIERHFTNNMRQEICRMYVEEKMSAKAIAKKMSTGRGVIVKRLKEEGVEIRNSGVFNGTEKYRKGVIVAGETREKLKKATSARFKDPEFLKKYREAINISPNKPETKILALLENLYPSQWKFTGDFSFVINGKSPDFVNCNGQKKIIELFGDYWHKGQNPQDRADIFSPFGYETLVIWERELKNMENVKNRIQDFHERKAA